jgi:uncharacterized phage-associated protein
MTNVYDVAAFIEAKLGPLSEYKLQKLVYYAQAWSLAWDDKPLFAEVIKAWPDGPVSPQLWHRRDNGTEGDPDALGDEQIQTINVVLDVYGDMTAQQLIDLSHREAPWREARRGVPAGAPSKRAISRPTMRAYYGGLVGESGEKAIPESVQRGMRVLLQVPEERVEDLFKATQGIDGDAMIAWLRTGKDDPWQEA